MRYFRGIRCSNIKVSFPRLRFDEFKTESGDLEDLMKKFTIIRCGAITVTRYPRSKTLHVTGIRDFSKLEYTAKVLSTRINVSEDEILKRIRIDNTTHHYNLGRRVNVSALKMGALDHERVSEVKEHGFPGIVIKTDSGSAKVFNTGLVNILGCKTFQAVTRTVMIVIDLVTQLEVSTAM